MRYPAPFVDEAWFASRAWAFIHTGRAFGPLDAGVIDRFEGYWTFLPWLPTFFQSIGLCLAGAPTLLAVRGVSLAFGLLLAAAVYVIGRRLGGWKLGLLSAFLVATSRPFLYSAHLARPDVMAAALGYVAIALHLVDRNSRWWIGLLSGLCVGAAFEVHAHSAIYGPALLALHVLRWRSTVFRQPHFWGFVAGTLGGLAFYLALHVLPYPQTYLALTRLAFGPTHTPPLLTFDPLVIGRALTDIWLPLVAVYLLLIPLVLWAAAVLTRERSTTGRTLVVLSAVLVAACSLFVRNKAYYYLILITPAIDMMAAALVLDVSQQPWTRRFGDYARRAIVWGLLLGSLALNVTLVQENMVADYEAAQEQLNAIIQAGEAIMGPQTYWFGLYDHRYYSWEELVYYRRYAPGSTVEDALREFRPDVLIIDSGWNAFITERPGDSLYLEHLWLPRAEMDAFLSRHAELAGSFDNAYYGHFRIYRISWGTE